MGVDKDEFRAGEFVPAGRYVPVDDAAGRVIQLRGPGRLPPSFDGRVAIYRRLPARGGPASQDPPGPGPREAEHPGKQAMLELPAAPTAGRPAYLLVFSAYFAFGVLLQVFPPLLDAVSAAFGVGRGSAALVLTLFLAPLVLLCVPIGLLVDRQRVRRVGRAAFLLMLFGGGLTALAGSLPPCWWGASSLASAVASWSSRS